MGFGASILNNFGFVLIDQDFFNLTFKSKATISSISAATLASSYGVTPLYTPPGFAGVFFVVDFTGTNPVLAVTPPVGRKLFRFHIYNELNTTSPPATGYQRAIFYLEGSTATSITYYIFDQVNPTGLTNVGNGIQILNASSQLVYHHSIPVMRAKSLVTLSGGAVGSTLSMPAGRTHAYVFCNMSMGFYYPASGGTRLSKDIGFELTSSTLTTLVSTDSYDNNQAGPISAGSIKDIWPSQGFVVDVSFM